MSVHFINKAFNQLTLKELYQIMVLRQQVFVVEQNCPYLDADGLDEQGLHLMGLSHELLVAYTRIIPPGKKYAAYAAITRVVIAKENRKTGLGRKLMEESLKLTDLLYGKIPVQISAQAYLTDFYASLGFKITSGEYLEDGILHIDMLWIK